MSGRVLEGRRIMVTRPEGQNEALCRALRELGAHVREAPVLRCVPPADDRPLREALMSLPQFDWMVFTSVNGVRATAQRMDTHGGTLPATLDLAAIGPATAEAIRSAYQDVQDVFIPSEYIAESLASELPVLPGARILLPQARRARPVLADMLRLRQVLVTQVEAYDVAPVDAASFRQSVGSEQPDWIVLTSPSGVQALVGLLRSSALSRWLTQSRLACIGPVTADACVRLGLRVDLIPSAHTEAGLVEALCTQRGEHR